MKKPAPYPHPASASALVGPLPSGEGSAFAAICSEKTFAAGDWLLQAGERAVWCHFITHGLVRELYVSDSGEEHTRSFLGVGQATGSMLDLLSGEPAVTWIQALEPTQTIAFRYSEFDALSRQHPALADLARRNAEQLAIRKTRREYEMLALTAAQRYQRWLEQHAELDAKISRRLLASYLGVTPEHLSRLSRSSARPAPPATRTRRRG